MSESSYIGRLEMTIARLRLVDALARAPKSRGAVCALRRHYLWLWKRTAPILSDTLWAHDIKEAFKQDHNEIVVIDLNTLEP